MIDMINSIRTVITTPDRVRPGSLILWNKRFYSVVGKVPYGVKVARSGKFSFLSANAKVVVKERNIISVYV